MIYAEHKTVIFSFFWNFFTLCQKIYTSAATGATDKYQVWIHPCKNVFEGYKTQKVLPNQAVFDAALQP